MKKTISAFLIAGTLNLWAAQAVYAEAPQFSYDNLHISFEKAIDYPVIRITFDVTNSGDKSGSETPRVHYQCPACPISKALGAARTVSIEPGGIMAIKVILPQYDVAAYAEGQRVKILSKGEHRFVIRSSQDVNQLDASFTIEEDIVFPFQRGFSGPVSAKWNGPRKMILISRLTFIDGKGKRWIAPGGANLNGATIPRLLWSSIGSPFIGKYRRASAIHDFFVGEDGNPKPLNRKATKAADRMFFEACLSDGCDVKFAATLYAGARFGSRLRTKRRHIAVHSGAVKIDIQNRKIEDAAKEKEFWKKIKKLGRSLDNGDLDKIDAAFPIE